MSVIGSCSASLTFEGYDYKVYQYNHIKYGPIDSNGEFNWNYNINRSMISDRYVENCSHYRLEIVKQQGDKLFLVRIDLKNLIDRYQNIDVSMHTDRIEIKFWDDMLQNNIIFYYETINSRKKYIEFDFNNKCFNISEFE